MFDLYGYIRYTVTMNKFSLSLLTLPSLRELGNVAYTHKEFTMQYHFVYNESVYTTPFSHSGFDFMDEARMLIDHPSQPERLARLLDEVALYESMLSEPITDTWGEYISRRVYSLKFRITTILS